MTRSLIALVGILFSAVAPAQAQSPFVMNDVSVAGPGVFHVEVFNEYDWLPRAQAPHLRQNTLNMRVNVGVGHGWEADLDSPWSAVTNTPASTPERVVGSGDTNFGLKYHVRDEESWRVPALALVAYSSCPRATPSAALVPV